MFVCAHMCAYTCIYAWDGHVCACSQVWAHCIYTWGPCLCTFTCVGTPILMGVVVRGQPQLFSPMSCPLVFWGTISEAHPFSHASCQQVPGTPRLCLLPGITNTHPHMWPVQEELHYWATPLPEHQFFNQTSSMRYYCSCCKPLRGFLSFMTMTLHFWPTSPLLPISHHILLYVCETYFLERTRQEG